ncbi:MAG: GNAT family N-acetyltransferase [Chitinophagaceae bacterium]|nr:GNAT family N-acetyltransferase [Chitinophagaceae bacterium]
MIHCRRTNISDPGFQQLVARLDAELGERDGTEHDFYAQFNSLASIPYAIVAYEANEPVGCGALKPYSDDTMEVKRMFVVPALRGKGIASAVLNALEQWASELGYQNCTLETGKRQPEAIALYKKSGYAIIPNYGQYENVENSICFLKKLNS